MLGFRVWDSENKEFCKNNYGSDWRQWCVRDDGRLCDRGDDFLEEYEEKRYIPMQSTGIKDFQGTLIYEGDIVWIRYLLLGTDGKPLFNRTETTYLHVENVVDFLQIIGRLSPIDKISCDGNVYDHPKLLERISNEHTDEL